MMTMLQRLLERLVSEDQGQDLVEYALLTGAIGFGAVVAFSTFGGAIHAVYTSWTGGVNGLWETPDPQP